MIISQTQPVQSEMRPLLDRALRSVSADLFDLHYLLTSDIEKIKERISRLDDPVLTDARVDQWVALINSAVIGALKLIHPLGVALDGLGAAERRSQAQVAATSPDRDLVRLAIVANQLDRLR